MKFKYSAVVPNKPNDPWVKRSILEIEVFGSSGNRKFNAMVDSGADLSLFNIQVAQLLGIDLSDAKIKPFIGIGGNTRIPAYIIDNVEIKIGGLGRKVKIPIGFIDSDSVGLLLGQEGFFDTHRIKFEKDHDTFEVTPLY